VTEPFDGVGDKFDLAVVGLGYVGLPLVIEATNAGLRVCGIDSHQSVVDGLCQGSSHIDDVSDTDIAEAIEAGLVVTSETSHVADASAVVMCVPTPLRDGGPDLSAVEGATRAVAAHLKPGRLVVLESTTYPGTTDEVVVPLLEEVSGLDVPGDVMVAYSPERIDPGNHTWTLRNTPKVVGGADQRSLEAAALLYGKVCNQVVRASSMRAAEMSKLLENTYRHVNIALVNELALVADDLGVDIFEIIDLAASKPFGFQAFYPGPGVGGHCIPIDPHYLSYRLRSLGRGFRFVELAREINDSMPAFVVLRAIEVLNRAGKAVRGARVVVAGVAYKPGVADTRETPAIPILRRLAALGANLIYVDPLVSGFTVDGDHVARADDLVSASEACDLLIIITPHPEMPIEEAVRRAPAVLDTRGVTSSPNVERL